MERRFRAPARVGIHKASCCKDGEWGRASAQGSTPTGGARRRLHVQTRADATGGPDGAEVQIGQGLDRITAMVSIATAATGRGRPRRIRQKCRGQRRSLRGQTHPCARPEQRERSALQKGLQINKIKHGRGPWQGSRNTQTRVLAKGRWHRQTGHHQGPCLPVHAAHTQEKQQGRGNHQIPSHRYRRKGSRQGGGRWLIGTGLGLHKATHDPGAGVRRPGRQQPSRLAGVHCDNWHIPRWGSGNKDGRLLHRSIRGVNRRERKESGVRNELHRCWRSVVV